MLINLTGRRIHFDLAGPDAAPVVCLLHSLAADGGMWAEQLPPLLAGGYRVLRLDTRGHGGSTVAGDHAMSAADDVAWRRLPILRPPCRSLDGMIGRHSQSRTPPADIRHACDTRRRRRLAPRPQAAADRSRQQANSLEPLADATMGRWFTDTAAPAQRWEADRETPARRRPAAPPPSSTSTSRRHCRP
jgi:3-oxoadipate enol-lactonase